MMDSGTETREWQKRRTDGVVHKIKRIQIALEKLPRVRNPWVTWERPERITQTTRKRKRDEGERDEEGVSGNDKTQRPRE